jgi:hypothetical protein
LRQRREWEFLVRFLVRVITRSLLLKVWGALAHLVRVVLVVRLVPAVRVAQVAPVVLVVQLVLVVLVVRVDSQAHLVQVLVAVLRVAHRVPVALVVQVEAQVLVAVAVLAVELLVLSVRAAHAVRARLVSQSVQSAKNLNSVQMRHHLVVQLFHAVMALPFCVFVAVRLSKTLPTRLTQLRVS